MKIRRHRIVLNTTEPIEFVDITSQVKQWVQGSGLNNGLLTLFSPHTTARINLNEQESELQHDMAAFLGQLVPQDAPYKHNVDTVDDRANAHSHLLGLFMNASESVPLVDGSLLLGQWQSIFFVELDGPRAQREVHLQLLGVE